MSRPTTTIRDRTGRVRRCIGGVAPGDDPAKSSFREALGQAGLSQRDLARLLGKAPTTVNRWCSTGAVAALDPPFYARAYVALVQLLTPAQRARILAVKA